MPITNITPSGAVENFDGASTAEMEEYAVAIAKMLMKEMVRPFALAERFKKAQVAHSRVEPPKRVDRGLHDTEQLKRQLLSNNKQRLEKSKAALAATAPATNTSGGSAGAGKGSPGEVAHEWLLDASEKTHMQALSNLTKEQKKEIKGKEKKDTILCVACVEKVKRLYIERDHATSADAISVNESGFLGFLNKPENAKFVPIFLRQPGMKELFSMVQGVVEITDYAAKSSYNAKLNLWPLCRDCNIGKSNDPPLVWMKGNRYLSGAAEAIEKDGMLNGVIIPCVYGKKPPDAKSIMLGGTEVFLFPDNARHTSLSDYIMLWVIQNYPKMVQTVELAEQSQTAVRRDLDAVVASKDVDERTELGVHQRRALRGSSNYYEGLQGGQKERRKSKRGDRSKSHSPEGQIMLAGIAQGSGEDLANISPIIREIKTELRTANFAEGKIDSLFTSLGRLSEIRATEWDTLLEDVKACIGTPNPSVSLEDNVTALFVESVPKKPARKRMSTAKSAAPQPSWVDQKGQSPQGGNTLYAAATSGEAVKTVTDSEKDEKRGGVDNESNTSPAL